jgi:hypothetical protein
MNLVLLKSLELWKSESDGDSPTVSNSHNSGEKEPEETEMMDGMDPSEGVPNLEHQYMEV